MSEQENGTIRGQRNKRRSAEQKLAGHWLMSLVKNRRKETAIAIILLLLAVAAYDSGDNADETPSDESMENIEELLGGFETETTTPVQSESPAAGGGLTIPQADDSELMDPFAALTAAAEGSSNTEPNSQASSDSIMAFSNDPIQITPASSSRSETQPDTPDFESQFPFAEEPATAEPPQRIQVRLTGTIETVQ